MPTPLTDADKVLRNDTGKDIVEKLDDIAQALGVGVNADQINYDNTESGLTADNAQDAIDEIKDITDDLDEKIDDKTSYESTASGSIATFSDGGDNIPMKSCEVAIVAQQASGTPSPSNPRAITGFSSISVPVVGGKNLFGGSDGVNYPLIIPANKTFTLSCSAGGGKFEYFRKDGTLIDYYFFGYNQSRTITCPETIYSVTLTTVNTPYQNAQIEFANSPTTYEAFKANNITPVSLGQTIYGGTAELVGGNGIKTFEIVDLGTLSYTALSRDRWQSDGISTTVKSNPTSSVVANILCTHYQAKSADNIYNQQIGIAIQRTNINLYDTALVGLTREQVSTALSGVYLVYELAAPTSFTFTGANIPTLSGVNNIYADSGDVNELEYFNKNADEIADAIRSVTTNKMDKVNPTGSGVFNFDGNGVLTDDLTIMGNKSLNALITNLADVKIGIASIEGGSTLKIKGRSGLCCATFNNNNPTCAFYSFSLMASVFRFRPTDSTDTRLSATRDTSTGEITITNGSGSYATIIVIYWN